MNQPHTPATIREALYFIPADCDRETWVRLAMATKAELGDGGFSIWDEWSQSGATYNASEARSVWRGIKEGGRVGIGSLFYEAMQHGFKFNGHHARHIGAAELDQIRRERELRIKQEEAERTRRQDSAAKLAEEIYSAAKKADDSHPYLKRKGVSAAPGVRVGRWYQIGDDGKRYREKENCLLIPIRDESGNLWNVQAIFPETDASIERDRDYLDGGRKQGCYFSIGSSTERIVIAEGYATAKSIHEASGGSLSVAVAFDVGNLLPVAKALRAKLPDARLTIAADNDIRSDGKRNIGVVKAHEAAVASAADVAIPELDGKPCDFNDVLSWKGRNVVMAAIEGARQPEAPKTEGRQQEKQEAPMQTASVVNFPQDGSWPKPEPLAAEHEKHAFPIDDLPGSMGAAVKEVQEITQAPESIVAFSALSTLSLAGQALVDVERADSLSGPVSLYLMAIAESGERKSTVDRLFSTPIDEWESARRLELEPDRRQRRADFAIWEAKKEAALNAIKTAKKGNKPTNTYEAELGELERSSPVEVRWPQLKYADSTPESLAWDLAKPSGWPSGGILSSEAGIVLGSHGMGRDSIMRNLALLNALWDGASHNVNRRTSESFRLEGVRLTTGLAAQPDVVRNFLDNAAIARGIGFIARFLIAWPDSNQGFRVFKEAASWPHLDDYRARIAELLSMPMTLNDRGGLQPTTLRFSPDGKAQWIKFYEDTEAELRPGKSLSEMKDIASKAADNVARIAALFHLYQHGPTGNISDSDVIAAARIVAWHLSEAKRFLGDMALPEAAVDALRLSEWLSRYCRGELPISQGKKTASLPQRIAHAYGPVRKAERFHRAMAELQDAHHAALLSEGKNRLIRVNPALLEG